MTDTVITNGKDLHKSTVVHKIRQGEDGGVICLKNMTG